jgi:hypothetical protein
MAITKSILQNVRQQTVVKLINDGSSAVQSASVTLRELKLADETFLGDAFCNVNIQTVIFSASDSSANPIVIARGNTLSNAFIVGNVMYLHGADSFELDQGAGFHDQTLFNANIAVLMPPQSLLYLVLGKTTGYQEPDQQTKF